MASTPRRAAVLGRPISHSLSPALHRAAYAALGLDWTYEAIDCGVADLAAVLAARPDWAGFSCTMPLKHAALDIAAEVAPLAAAVGAVNTLLPRVGGGWRAENTDVIGIMGALAERDVRGAPPRTATVIGAGGTAQAAVAALAQLGVATCGVLVRDTARVANLATTAAALGVQLDVAQLRVDAAQLDADMIISTIPPGGADAVAGHGWRSGQVLLDVVYDPWPTWVAAAAEAAGGIVISGAAVLLHQAAAQVELMTGYDAPIDAMRSALRAVS